MSSSNKNKIDVIDILEFIHPDDHDEKFSGKIFVILRLYLIDYKE